MPNLSASVSEQKFNELSKMVHATEPQGSEPEDSVNDQDQEWELCPIESGSWASIYPLTRWFWRNDIDKNLANRSMLCWCLEHSTVHGSAKLALALRPNGSRDTIMINCQDTPDLYPI